MIPLPKYLSASVALLAAAVSPVAATEYIFEDYEVTLLRADATPWDYADLQLGNFSGGFTPTAANTDDWLSHWTGASSFGYHDGSGPEWSALLTLSDNTLFSIGSSLFLWAFDTQVLPGAQWALFQDPTWLIEDNDDLDLEPVFLGFTDATQAVYGRFDGGQQIASTVKVTAASVPDSASTALLLGLAMTAVGALFRRR